MSLQAMTHIAHYHDDQQIVYPTLDQKSFHAPPSSNPDEYLTSYPSHPHSPRAESHPPRSLSSDAQSSGENSQSSRRWSNGPASLSSSTMASSLNAKMIKAQSVQPAQPTFPAAAIILATRSQPASMSDHTRALSWNEPREWAQAKNDMALGRLAMEPVSPQPRTHVSVVDTDGDDEYDEDDDDDYDEAAGASDHENAFYILQYTNPIFWHSYVFHSSSHRLPSSPPFTPSLLSYFFSLLLRYDYARPQPSSSHHIPSPPKSAKQLPLSIQSISVLYQPLHVLKDVEIAIHTANLSRNHLPTLAPDLAPPKALTMTPSNMTNTQPPPLAPATIPFPASFASTSSRH
ncbi:predicted protein [Uncinocarpus reesii 1704]|uniref:Uncharacterized protein n=1 Tax=Uncinocarpus reesii (strain UAMH 1704) TaxID=336963 RepID=C4JXB9_UNCRE|nr:uncharacterized protein UREG_06292 [Uncinocarpus reesii 1704]EEP81427.1 predicted protein [Uncinocarpus reesii 1704]